MIKKILKQPLFWIFILAFLLRIYKLGTFPYGFHVDEAKVGWNALSILKTGLDDHGGRLSLYYNSFGDYRPTGIFYVTVPWITIFGRSVFAVRFASALFGALTIFPIYFLFNLILEKIKSGFFNLDFGHIASLLLAISPWHIETSRATSEVVISTFFALSTICFLIKLIESKKHKYLFLVIVSTTISYLLYHAVRFLAPIFLLVIVIFYFNQIKGLAVKRFVVICLAFSLILTLFFSTTKEGKERFSQVSIFNDQDVNYEIERIRSENKTRNMFTVLFDNKEVIYVRRFMTEYSQYFSGDFLIGDAAKPYRYTTPGMGILTYIEVILFGIGILEIVKGKRSFLPLILLLIAPLPAALTTEDAPNLHRAFLMLPMIIIIEAYGFEQIIGLSKKYRNRITVVLLSLLTLNFILFLHMYFTHSSFHKPYIKDFVPDGSTYRNLGSIELAYKIESVKDKYKQIIVTSKRDNNYVWYAFFSNKDPEEFNTYVRNNNNGNIQYHNILFSSLPCPSDDSFTNYKVKKLLVIDFGDCAIESKIKDGLPIKITDQILRPDGTVAYKFLERK